jgi:hypothetical protein
MLLIDLAVLAILQSPPQAAAPAVGDVGWIAGCWEFTTGDRHVSEYWMPAEGDTLIGMSRTVVGGKTTEWEFLVIRRGVKTVEYIARPSGQAEAIFTATSISAAAVTFENAAHDFPKKIVYARNGDSLVASIEGPMNGRTERIEFPYRQAACGVTR